MIHAALFVTKNETTAEVKMREYNVCLPYVHFRLIALLDRCRGAGVRRTFVTRLPETATSISAKLRYVKIICICGMCI